MLKTYNELLDIAQSLNLSVYEDVPLEGEQRGIIHINTVLMSEDLTDYGKRAVLSEEIIHYQTDSGDISRNERRELRAHKKLIEENVSLTELLDAIIELGYNADFYSVAELLEIPEWLCKEAYKYYSSFPFKDRKYKGFVIHFNPLRVLPEEFYA